jgi:hypothetical protein
MPSTNAAVRQGERERDLLDQWVRSANHNEIGLLDLIVLNEWITQIASEEEPVCPESDREPTDGRTLLRQFFR